MKHGRLINDFTLPVITNISYNHLKNYTSTVTLWLDKIFPHLASPTEQLATCRATTVTYFEEREGKCGSGNNQS
jgi:hypothetical protein